MSVGKVPCPVPVSKQSVLRELSEDWRVLDDRFGRDVFTAMVGAKHKNTVGAAIGQIHLPEAHTILNSLLVDHAALFNTFSKFGGVFVPVNPEAVDDMALISQMLHAATEAVDRKRDGVWCPSDKAALAKLFRPLIPVMLAIVHQANGEPVGHTLKAVG